MECWEVLLHLRMRRTDRHYIYILASETIRIQCYSAQLGWARSLFLWGILQNAITLNTWSWLWIVKLCLHVQFYVPLQDMWSRLAVSSYWVIDCGLGVYSSLTRCGSCAERWRFILTKDMKIIHSYGEWCSYVKKKLSSPRRINNK